VVGADARSTAGSAAQPVHSHYTKTKEDLQTKLDSAHKGVFLALSNESYECRVCVPRKVFSTVATGAFVENLKSHLNSVSHKGSVAAQHKQLAIHQLLPLAESESSIGGRAKHVNVTVHICSGYCSRKVTYWSRKFNTRRTLDPMVLIYDAQPLPAIPELDSVMDDDDSVMDLTVDLPSWTPHVHGHDAQHNYPHFTANKCRGTWVTTTLSSVPRDPVEVREICSECTQVPFMPSFRKRLVRAYERVARGGPQRGMRSGPDAANHPTLRELYDNFPVVVKAYRRERRQKAYYLSVVHKLKSRLKKFQFGCPRVCEFSASPCIVCDNKVCNVYRPYCPPWIPCFDARKKARCRQP
jgi:hypothetical protein